jgi:hypothetical protein
MLRYVGRLGQVVGFSGQFVAVRFDGGSYRHLSPARRADDLLMDDEFFPSLSRAVYYNRSGDPIGVWQWAILHSEDNAIWCPRQRCGYRGDKAQFYKLKLVRPML